MLKKIISSLFIGGFLVLSSSISSFGVSSVAFADEEQKNTEVRIREPFPGQSNVINVSVDRGSISILAEYVSDIFKFVAALSAIISVIVLMAAGFKIMVSGGDSAARDEAKEWIQKVAMGLAFLFLSGLFLKTVNPNFYLLS